MMTTFQDIYQRARAAGLDDESARDEATRHFQHLRGIVAQAVAAQAQAEAPARDVLAERGYDEMDRRTTAALDAALDPQRAHRVAAERERIRREAAPLIAQRDELNRRLAELDAEYRQWL